MARNEAHRLAQRDWYERVVKTRRQEWLKANGPCKVCGSWDNLEVDHIDPTTKIHHSVWSWSAKRRIAELAKCQTLCEKCHLQKSIAYFKKSILPRKGEKLVQKEWCGALGVRNSCRLIVLLNTRRTGTDVMTTVRIVGVKDGLRICGTET